MQKRYELVSWEAEQKIRADVFRRCAEEIENSLRSGSVPPEQLLRNCAAWYRAQAEAMDPDYPGHTAECLTQRSLQCSCGLSARLRAESR